ncbi:MAG: peptidylprolyl isomerase [Clostridia bacterium]|nr:peptidylprolyl isomerase [Clostridia bacterium]
MKRLLAAAMAAVLLFVIAGCAKTTETVAPTEVPAAQEETAATEESAAEAAVAEEKTTAEETAAIDETPAEDVLLVTLNGDEIYTSDLNEYVNNILSYYSSYGYALDSSDETVMKSVRAMALMTALQYKLLYQKAEETGITAAVEAERAEIEESAKAEWESIVAEFETEMYGISDASTEEEKSEARLQVLSLLESDYGYTESLYVSEAVDSKIMEQIQAAMAEGVEVTDDEVKASFEEKVAADKEMYENDVSTYEFYTMFYGQESYYMPEGYRGITHILLKADDALLSDYTDKKTAWDEQQNAGSTPEAVEETDDSADAEPAETAEPVTEEQVAAAKQAVLDSVQDKVAEIMSKFEAGTPFADLIAEYGEDPGMEDEANLTNGYNVHKDSVMWDPAFTEGAMTLEKVGDISAPVVGSYGVHILYYLRDIPGGAVEMTDEIAATVREELQSVKESDSIDSVLNQWMTESEIVYTDAGNELKALTDEMSAQDAGTEEEGTEDATAEETVVEEATVEEAGTEE